jgi:hypothetical protein
MDRLGIRTVKVEFIKDPVFQKLLRSRKIGMNNG